MVRAGGKVELQLAYPELKLIFVEGVEDSALVEVLYSPGRMGK